MLTNLNLPKPNNSNTTTAQLPILPNAKLRPILGNICFDFATKDLYVSDGINTYTFGNGLVPGTGIAVLNGLTATSQLFAIGTTGTDFNIVSVGNTHTFNIPDASPLARGLITTGVQTIAGNKTLTGNTTLLNVIGSTINSTTNIVAADILHSATTSINVSAAAAPSVGQVLTATSGTTATWQNVGGILSAITSLNGLTASVQTLSLGTAGIDLNWVPNISDNKLNVPDASATARGVITIGTQTIAGDKTLTGNTQLNNVINSVIDSNTNTVRASSLGTTTAPVVVNTAIAPSVGQVLTATSATSADWQTNVGLSYFADSQSTNAGQTTSGFTPIVGVDLNFGILTAGTGAIVRTMPDNTPVGGNNRGQYATDLQKTRTVATQVASGNDSTISGGRTNTANATTSTVGGGQNNVSSADNATVAGGLSNTASATDSTVGGGRDNISNGVTSVIAGGGFNTASGAQATVSGGQSNNATGLRATVSGGIGNTASGEQGTVSGGSNNNAVGSYSTVSGGLNNNATVATSTIGGGQANISSADNATVAGGLSNTANATNSTVGGGRDNISSGEDAVVAGGGFNTANNTRSTVGGGQLNIASGPYSVIGGGQGNQAASASFGYTTIGGGQSNLVNGEGSTIAGGQFNQIDGQGGFVSGYGLFLNTGTNYGAAFGRFNTPGNISGSTRLLMLGAGASSGSPLNIFSITNNGNSNITGNYQTGGADFAEYFESNLTRKIPVGTTVTFENGKIKPAVTGEIPFGVISGSAGVVGNAHSECWNDRFLRDDFGEIIFEDVIQEQTVADTETVTENYLDIETNIVNGVTVRQQIQKTRTVEKQKYQTVDLLDINGNKIGAEQIRLTKTVTQTFRESKVNPLYDPTKIYVPRCERPEWNVVGLLGQVKIIKGQALNPKWIFIKNIDSVYDSYLISL